MITSDDMQYIWSELRDYQKEAFLIMKDRKSNLFYDDMGLGKTLTTLFTAVYKESKMFNTEDYSKKILILCPTRTMGVWQDECQKWFDLPSLIYWGTAAKRKKMDLGPYPFVIATYAMAKELTNLPWAGFICDEIHEVGLFNSKCVTYSNIIKLVSLTKWSFLLTGTPIRQGVIDSYGPLHLSDGVCFPSYWGFVNKWCIQIQTPFGKEIQRRPKNIVAFREMMSHYMVRRTKKELGREAKQRQSIPLKLTALQRDAYQRIAEDLLYYDDDTCIATPNKMTAIMRVRQLLVTPRILGIDQDGAGLEYLLEEGTQLLLDDKPFVVFTPFKEALAIIEDKLRSFKGEIHFYVLSGNLNPMEFTSRWKNFQNDPYEKKVMLCTIKSAASFQATAAADCFFLGYEWDFNLNAQAEDRLCRDGQKFLVNCRYIVHEDTIDEAIRQRLNDKNNASDWIVGTEEQYMSLLKEVRGKIKK